MTYLGQNEEVKEVTFAEGWYIRKIPWLKGDKASKTKPTTDAGEKFKWISIVEGETYTNRAGKSSNLWYGVVVSPPTYDTTYAYIHTLGATSVVGKSYVHPTPEEMLPAVTPAVPGAAPLPTPQPEIVEVTKYVEVSRLPKWVIPAAIVAGGVAIVGSMVIMLRKK